MKKTIFSLIAFAGLTASAIASPLANEVGTLVSVGDRYAVFNVGSEVKNIDLPADTNCMHGFLTEVAEPGDAFNLGYVQVKPGLLKKQVVSVEHTAESGAESREGYNAWAQGCPDGEVDAVFGGKLRTVLVTQ